MPGDRGGTLSACAAIFAVGGLGLLLVWLVCSRLKGTILCAIAEYHHAQLLRASVAPRELSNEIFLSIPTMVEKAYLTLFPLLVLGGLINMIAVFMMNSRPESSVALLLYPVFVLGLVCCRGPSQEQLETEDAEIAGSLASASQALLAASHSEQRRAAVSDSIEKFEALCESSSELRRFKLCSKPLMWALTVVVATWYAAYGGQQVLQGSLTLETYMQSQSDFFIVGLLFYSVYTTLCERIQSVTPLVALMKVLNAGTKVEEGPE